MLIGGLQKFSLIDFPQKTSAIIFTQGCNFRCGYCHNPELVYLDKFQIPIPETEIFAFLKTRRNLLDAVVVTGGEPTIQPDLTRFIKKTKELGYLVKLDTNGSNPKILGELINKKLIDFVAMDIKGTFDKYNLICGIWVNIEDIKKSIAIIKSSNIKHEFRTTYDTTKLNQYDINKIKKFFYGDNHRMQHCNKVTY